MVFKSLAFFVKPWEKKKRERERAKVGDNNGQATHGARKHAWRTQAAWAKSWMKLEGVKVLSDSFTESLNKLEQVFEKDFPKDVTGNSAKSVDALNSMNKHMETLLSKFNVPNPVTASVSSSETTDASVQNAAVQKASADVTPAKKDDKPKCRKGLFFSSSIALLCEKKKLEYELDCELEIV